MYLLALVSDLFATSQFSYKGTIPKHEEIKTQVRVFPKIKSVACLSADLSIFLMAGKHNRFENVDMSTFEHI
jgi:hypothetical protein